MGGIGDHPEHSASQIVARATLVSCIDEQAARRRCLEAAAQLFNLPIAKNVIQAIAAYDYTIFPN